VLSWAREKEAAHLELLHLGLDELARLGEGLLVLDLVAGEPRLDLVPVPLQLLDLLLQVLLELLLVVGVASCVHLLPDLVEHDDPLLHLLEGPVDLRL
jgi:hypothetical protein